MPKSESKRHARTYRAKDEKASQIGKTQSEGTTSRVLIAKTNQLLSLLLTSLGRPIRDLLLNSWGLLNNWGSRNRNFFQRGQEGRRRNDSRILNSCSPLQFRKMGVKNSGEISEHKNVYTNLRFALTGSSTVTVGGGDTERPRFLTRLPAGDKGSRSDRSLRSSFLLSYS